MESPIQNNFYNNMQEQDVSALAPDACDGTVSGYELLANAVAAHDPFGIQGIDFQEIRSLGPDGDAHHLFKMAFQGHTFGFGCTPGRLDILDVPVDSLFNFIRANLLPRIMDESTADVQLMLGFKDLPHPIVHETEPVAARMSLQQLQELAALANNTDEPPRFELQVRESLPCQLTRLQAEDLAQSESDSWCSSEYSDESSLTFSTPRELTPEDPELEPEFEPAELGVPVVLFAPERRVTRSMTRAQYPEPDPVPTAYSRPKRIIRRVILDYDDIIKHDRYRERTSRL
ncbi:hypothetical protein BGZ52_006436 [Haplosporangium bisporale]|nr:hypothetical protein BGZ52_006436 [Haplosporangium bisporale]KAF9202795.1 hypothetical protein BGZ59_001972 [Podila verticillata]KAI9235425.1 MAG: hypothetical protein BYD32DRAFT_421132 [Podila humilis]KFH72036.1 hypothetical protein MVEG_02329 [Podila verticillata NRRL 6337]